MKSSDKKSITDKKKQVKILKLQLEFYEEKDNPYKIQEIKETLHRLKTRYKERKWL